MYQAIVEPKCFLEQGTIDEHDVTSRLSLCHHPTMAAPIQVGGCTLHVACIIAQSSA